MTNKDIARRLKQTAALVELTGGNPYRARAYSSAARKVDQMDAAVLQLVEQDELTGVAGIGDSIARDVEALVRTGTFPTLDALLESLPPGLLDVLRVKGLGPKKVRALWQELGVTSLEDLEEVALTGRIAELGGFGKKTQEAIVENVAQLKRYRSRRRYHEALEAVEPLLRALREAPGVQRAELTGALRRKLETVAAAEIVVAGAAEPLRDVLTAHAHASGEDEGAFFAGPLPNGLPLRVHRADAADFARTWWRTTGSEEHLRQFAARFGEPDPAEAEERLYRRVGLDWVPPELREGDGEIAAAEGGLPLLLTGGDLRGTLHNHSTYSDGAHTLRQMAEAARAMGYGYFGVCDHSRSLQIANGLPVERLREQGEEVRRLNAEFAHDGGPPFRIFHGTECDVLQDGSLDYPDDVLAELDFVVASVHQGFNMTEAEATERLVRAASNPYVSILGHLTGRLLLRREGYPVNHARVIAACAEHGTAIELNANPYRLDMDWRYVREATQQGVLISINPDAHSTDGLADVQWGVAVARKGWLTAEQCLNAKTAEAFEAWLAERTPAAT